MWACVAVIFVAGVWGRVEALDVPWYSGEARVVDASRWKLAQYRWLLEQDEKIYIALVEQIDAGHGYTLQGHPILSEPWIVAEQYGRSLFFHPPGGVALFWLAHRVAGERGYPLIQVVSFAVFFWSLMWLGTVVVRPFSFVTAIALALLGAFTPLMAHVAGRFWLDGPLLACATLASAVFLAGVIKGRWPIAALGGAVLGFASLIKLTAFLIVPGVIALAWAVSPREARRTLILCAVVFVGVAAVVQAPWEIWQWRVFGSPLPEWAGRPAPRLVQTNEYVNFLTVVRTPWMYLEMLPQVIWTLTPSVIFLIVARRVPGVARVGIALVVWIATVVGANMFLGSVGYSKVLRYVILVTPAANLLFAVTLGAVVDMARGQRPLSVATIVLLLAAIAGLGLEVGQGLRTSLHDNARLDLIRPLTGLPGMDR